MRRTASHRCSREARRFARQARETRKLYLPLLIGGGLLAARRFAPRVEDIDWAKRFAEMPEDFPPKWMFTNVAAIREQNDRILEMLAAERGVKAEKEEETPATV